MEREGDTADDANATRHDTVEKNRSALW